MHRSRHTLLGGQETNASAWTYAPRPVLANNSRPPHSWDSISVFTNGVAEAPEVGE